MYNYRILIVGFDYKCYVLIMYTLKSLHSKLHNFKEVFGMYEVNSRGIDRRRNRRKE